MKLIFSLNGAATDGPYTFAPTAQGQSTTFNGSLATATATCLNYYDSYPSAVEIAVSASENCLMTGYTLVYTSSVDGSTITYTGTYDPPRSSGTFNLIYPECDNGTLTIHFSGSPQPSTKHILRSASSGKILRSSSGTILRES